MPDGFVITDTTYAGEAASQFIVKAVTTAVTIDGGHVYVKDGIKKKFTIPRFDLPDDQFIQDRAATPVSKGQMNVTGQTLEPEDYMVYIEFNPRDYEDHWFATQLNPGLLDRALPTSVESVIIQEVLKKHAKFFNKIIWNGQKTNTDVLKYFDGLIKKAMQASGTIDVGSPTTLSATNIVAEFEKGYALIPDALKYDTSMKYFVSNQTYDYYQTAQQNQTYKGADFTTLGKDTYKTLPVVRIPDFPNNVYMIAKGSADTDSNLWVGMDSVDDKTQIKLAPLQANSELWFVKMLMKADVQIGWNEETVLYGTI